MVCLALNGHYEVGAKGEALNAGGKTDILVDWKGKNVFVVALTNTYPASSRASRTWHLCDEWHLAAPYAQN